MATEQEVKELYEKVWAYAPGQKDIELEINSESLWWYGDDLDENDDFVKEQVSDYVGRQGCNLTLTREEAKQLIKDLQEWLEGEM